MVTETTMTVKQQWDEIHAAAHRLDTFCRTIEALRLNETHDTTEEINYMERAAWCEARHIAELAALIPSPFESEG